MDDRLLRGEGFGSRDYGDEGRTAAATMGIEKGISLEEQRLLTTCTLTL
jgi:hypothetical protein